jgi:hypothetical protein
MTEIDASATGTPLSRRAEREIRDFHRFLTDLFNGDAPGNPALVEHHLNAFDPGFSYITHAGALRSLGDLSRWAANARGSQPGTAIEIRNVTVRRETPTSVLLTYEEHQTWTGGDSHRLSSVLFIAKPDAPNGVGWFHLHEVWLPDE